MPKANNTDASLEKSGANASPDDSGASQENEQEVDIATFGEEEFAEKTTETLEPSPEDKGAESASPEDKGGKDSESEDDKGGEESPSPEIKSQVDEVEEFLNEMTDLRHTSEENNTDEYAQRLVKLKEDPVRSRLWETELRVRGAHAGFQKERDGRRKFEKEVTALKANQEESKLDSFQELSEDELDELDKEEYAEYRIQKKDIERQRSVAKEGASTQQRVAQLGELEDFLFDRFGVELEKDEKGMLTQVGSDGLDKSFPVSARTKVDNELEKIFGVGVLYTADQIKLVYNDVMSDDILLQERTKAREQVKESQEAAARGQSRLDNLPRNSDRSNRQKKAEDYDPTEIAAMGEDEFDAFEEKHG